MRFLGVALLLALGPASLLAQDIEVSDDPPKEPEKPRTIEETVRDGLRWLRRYKPGGLPRRDGTPPGLMVEAFVLYARGAHGDLGKDDRARLTALHAAWKRDEDRKEFGQAADLAALVLALTAANPTPTRPAPSENPNRPPRGSRFDKDHWKLMHECVGRLTDGRGPDRQNSLGAWGFGPDAETTHIVLLALREAVRAGYPVDPEVFGSATRYLATFERQPEATPADLVRAMVCAWICCEQLAMAGVKGHDRTKAFAARTEALAPVFGDKEPLTIECLWALEQLGSMTGQAELGGRSWYREGTNRLLRATWLREVPETPEGALSICFALLFLKRGTAPLEAGK